ncbi:MAG: right-handed parallel beta-helix repeat-containing protein, partial [Clostridia bacterium]|nr:right-handed parallel beta-helix repeat-containing protein [Clostridia bacterium]
ALAEKAETKTDVTVLVEGTQHMDAPIVLSGEEKPEWKKLRLTFRSEEESLFTSLVEIKGSDFKKVEGKPYYTYQFEKDENGCYPMFYDFYEEGKRMAHATSPIWKNPFAFLPEERRGEKKLEGLYVPMAYAEAAKEEGCTNMQLSIRVQWEYFILRVMGVDTATTKDVNGEPYALVTFDKDFDYYFVCGTNGCNNIGDRPTRFVNTPAFLTEPGSFVYKWDEGLLYVIPNGDIKDLTFAYPTLENFFILKHMSDVRFEGLAFTGLTSKHVCENGYFSELANHEKKARGRLRHAAIYGEFCTDISVDGCRFYAMSCNAVQFRKRSVSIAVKNSRFYDIGMSGVAVGDYSVKLKDPTDRSYNTRVENNYFEKMGYDYPSSACIYIGMTDGAKALYNTIEGCAYSGIYCGYIMALGTFTLGDQFNTRNAELAYNRIDNFMDILRDGAAIYVTGATEKNDFSRRFNSIHDNFAYLDDGKDRDRRGYYLDASSSNWDVYDNVIHGCHFPVFTQYHVPSQYTHHNRVHH